VQIGVRARDVDLEVRQAAQAVTDRRDAAIEHRRIGDHHDAGLQRLAVLAHEVVEMRRADFLFALDEHLDVHRKRSGLTQPGLDGLEVHEDLALVIGAAARVDLAVAHRGLEGRRDPLVQRIHGLHVVVP
jgi:hypothetical protein